jgi:hypothetical protein
MDKNHESLSNPGDIGKFPVSVLMRYQLTPNNVWSNGQWDVSGVVVGEIGEKFGGDKQVIRNDTRNREYLCAGLTVELYKDDAESYYHNLMSDDPKAFVVCRTDETDDNQCEPFLVTLSYGEATSYMEVDELVYSVAMPPELYRWVEQFVLEHYVPEKKRKRRRENWKDAGKRAGHNETV